MIIIFLFLKYFILLLFYLYLVWFLYRKNYNIFHVQRKFKNNINNIVTKKIKTRRNREEEFEKETLEKEDDEAVHCTPTTSFAAKRVVKKRDGKEIEEYVCECRYPYLVNQKNIYSDCNIVTTCANGYGKLVSSKTESKNLADFDPKLEGKCVDCPRGMESYWSDDFGPSCRPTIHRYLKRCQDGDLSWDEKDCFCPPGFQQISNDPLDKKNLIHKFGVSAKFVNSYLSHVDPENLPQCVKIPCQWDPLRPHLFHEKNFYVPGYGCACDYSGGYVGMAITKDGYERITSDNNLKGIYTDGCTLVASKEKYIFDYYNRTQFYRLPSENVMQSQTETKHYYSILEKNRIRHPLQSFLFGNKENKSTEDGGKINDTALNRASRQFIVYEPWSMSSNDYFQRILNDLKNFDVIGNFYQCYIKPGNIPLAYYLTQPKRSYNFIRCDKNTENNKLGPIKEAKEVNQILKTERLYPLNWEPGRDSLIFERNDTVITKVFPSSDDNKKEKTAVNPYENLYVSNPGAAIFNVYNEIEIKKVKNKTNQFFITPIKIDQSIRTKTIFIDIPPHL